MPFTRSGSPAASVDEKHPPGTQDARRFPDRAGAIGHLAQHSDHEHRVECRVGERQALRPGANAGKIGEPAFLEALGRHREHGRLRVEKREMAGRQPSRDGRIEKAGAATNLKNAIGR